MVLAIDILGILSGNEMLRFAAKPLIVPVIFFAFRGAWRKGRTGGTSIMLALFFSWVGDILLMFDARDEIYFLAGLGAFLIAHLCYIYFFQRIRNAESIPPNIWLLLAVAVYYASLIFLLSGYLGDKEWPVRIYGIVISFMMLLALHLASVRNRKAGIMIMWGALLFILSDSILAIDRFYFTMEFAGVAVMLTYGFAQWLIVMGAKRWLEEEL
jgi:uncharacterized membrane protein YhhN